MPKDTGLGASGAVFVERIDSVRKKRGLSRQEIADRCGISLQGITNWSHRGTIPSADIALRIAECLDVNVEWLLTGKNTSGFTAEEEELIKGYRQIPSEAKRAVSTLVESYLNKH